MIAGIVFIIVWLALATVWFVMSVMAGAMANDAGTVSSTLHARLLITLVVGELVVAIAGIVGGCAFIWPDASPLLWRTFTGLLIGGILLQVVAVVTMARAI